MRVKTKVKTKIRAGFRGRGRDRGLGFAIRKKFCRFCKNKTRTIDYKDIETLENFITDRGKINSVRFSGNCAKHQRRLTMAIKKARFLALLPYVR